MLVLKTLEKELTVASFLAFSRVQIALRFLQWHRRLLSLLRSLRNSTQSLNLAERAAGLNLERHRPTQDEVKQCRYEVPF